MPFYTFNDGFDRAIFIILSDIGMFVKLNQWWGLILFRWERVNYIQDMNLIYFSHPIKYLFIYLCIIIYHISHVNKHIIIAGELSEAQKQALEQSNKKVEHQDIELIELRQQMAKLSQIIDKQSDEIRELTADLR